MINIINAKFISSSQNLSQCPDFGLSEVAFLGRSNVGKSSLINALCNQHGLAKSSSTPGKTQLINFFSAEFIDDEKKERSQAVFVDLPGFGYAKVSKSVQQQWRKNLSEFLRGRIHIRAFLHLIDSRHDSLENDENLSEFMAEFIRPDQKILRIYTKADKLNQSGKAKIKAKDKNAILVSAAKKTGINELKEQIFAQLLGYDARVILAPNVPEWLFGDPGRIGQMLVKIIKTILNEKSKAKILINLDSKKLAYALNLNITLNISKLENDEIEAFKNIFEEVNINFKNEKFDAVFLYLLFEQMFVSLDIKRNANSVTIMASIPQLKVSNN